MELASPGVVIAQNLKGFDVLRIAQDDSFHETDLDIQITLLAAVEFSAEINFFGHRSRDCFSSFRPKSSLRRKFFASSGPDNPPCCSYTVFIGGPESGLAYGLT